MKNVLLINKKAACFFGGKFSPHAVFHPLFSRPCSNDETMTERNCTLISDKKILQKIDIFYCS
jgi:hypothetical protein